MAVADRSTGRMRVAIASHRQARELVARRRGRPRRAAPPLLITSAIAIAIAASSSTSFARAPAQSAGSPAIRPADVLAATLSSSSSSPARINRFVTTAKSVYQNEVGGWKLSQQLTRIAGDAILLNALSHGDLTAAQAEANAQLTSPINHYAHVTRISVTSGSRVVVNATVNGDGVFVVAPGRRVLRLYGRVLGTLLVSLQDVVGFVKLVHRLTGAEVLVRGASGNVRTSLPAAAQSHLPMSGRISIAGRTYLVRSFGEVGWDNEALTVWILAAG